ncbi:endoglucanase [Sulfolobales archaeon HS-7]|nr:endoglucanase [Sulfolobales archaeon HS-7]
MISNLLMLFLAFSCITGNALSLYSYSPLKYGGINTDLWNLSSASGNVTMCVNGTLRANVNLTSISEKDPNDVVAGYPEIGYGRNLEDESWGPEEYLYFPLELNKFVSFNYSASISYRLNVPKNLPNDFSFDFWVENRPSPGHSPGPGDLEVMIWLYHTPSLYPAGDPYLTLTLPVTVNGVTENVEWTIYNGTGGANTRILTFESDEPVDSGTVLIDLSYFFEEVELLGNYSSFFLMGVELGTEFGTFNGGAHLSLYVYNYTLQNKSYGIELVTSSPVPSSSTSQPVTASTSPNSFYIAELALVVIIFTLIVIAVYGRRRR